MCGVLFDVVNPGAYSKYVCSVFHFMWWRCASCVCIFVCLSCVCMCVLSFRMNIVASFEYTYYISVWKKYMYSKMLLLNLQNGRIFACSTMC